MHGPFHTQTIREAEERTIEDSKASHPAGRTRCADLDSPQVDVMRAMRRS